MDFFFFRLFFWILRMNRQLIVGPYPMTWQLLIVFSICTQDSDSDFEESLEPIKPWQGPGLDVQEQRGLSQIPARWQLFFDWCVFPVRPIRRPKPVSLQKVQWVGQQFDIARPWIQQRVDDEIDTSVHKHMHIVTDGVMLLYFDLSLLAHSTLSFSGFQIYIVLLKHKVAFGICIDYAMVLKSRSESLRRACMHVKHSSCFARLRTNYVPLSIMAGEADKSDTQKPRSHQLSTALMAIAAWRTLYIPFQQSTA